MAQLVERFFRKEQVVGSNPTGGSCYTPEFYIPLRFLFSHHKMSIVKTTLWLLLFSWCLISCEINLHGDSAIDDPNKALDLIKTLHEKGYLFSAKAYAERLLRDPSINETTEHQLTEILLKIRLDIQQFHGEKRLPEMSEQPRFSMSPQVLTTIDADPNSKLPSPDEFPRTQFRKKIWIISSAVVLSGLAYYLYKEAHKTDPPPPAPSIGVSF